MPLDKEALRASCLIYFLSIIPTAQMTVGMIYLHDCPRQPYIPIYLMVMGIICIILAVLCNLPSEDRINSSGKRDLSYILIFILFCWFIAGNVCIYMIYEPNYDKNATDAGQYCNKTLYLFAFWTTNLVYILLGVLLVGSCCTFICSLLFGWHDNDNND